MVRVAMGAMPGVASDDMVMVATWVMVWATTEAMPRMAMEAMPRKAMEAMPRMAMEAMTRMAMEVMAREASEVAFGLLTASPIMVLDLMANLKAMVSSLPPLLPMASNLNLLTLPRMAKRRSHPNSLSLPSNLPTSNLVTLEHL